MADVSLLFNLLARDRTANGLNGAQSRFGKFQKAVAIGSAAAAAAVVGFAKAGLDGLMEQEEAQAKFAQAISKTSPAIRAQSGALMANAEAVQKNTRFTYEAALGASGFLAAQDGMRRAVGAGVTTIQDATAVTLDLATVLGIDATAAAGVLAKAMAAPDKATKSLQKAGVTLTAGEQEKIKALVKSGDVAAAQAIIMDKLKQKTEGAANAAGQTLAGKIERAKNAFGEMQEGLTVALLPAITAVTDAAARFSAWAQENPGKVKAVVIVVGALWATLVAVSLATKVWAAMQAIAAGATAAWTAAQWALNMAVSANPITLIVVAIIALVAIVVLIATKTTWFQQIWKAAWGAITGAVSSTLGWIRANWPLLLAILTGPIGLAVLAITKNWGTIKSGVAAVKGAIVSAMSGVAGFLTAPFTKAAGTISGIFTGIKNAFRSAINFIIGGWNGLRFSIPSFDTKIPGIGKVGGGSFGVPQIPYLAKGGNITREGMAIVGEKGPEMVSLGRGAQVTPLTGRGAGGPVRIELNLTGADDDLLRRLRNQIRVKGGDVQVVLGRA